MNEISLIKPILELGVTGILFVMWWFERKDRIDTSGRLDKVTGMASSFENMSKEMIACIKENTTATVKLLQRIEHNEESTSTRRRN